MKSKVVQGICSAYNWMSQIMSGTWLSFYLVYARYVCDERRYTEYCMESFEIYDNCIFRQYSEFFFFGRNMKLNGKLV
jgi:hypothetical protein